MRLIFAYLPKIISKGDPVPMDMMIDDQARAFFDIVLGATWLFTGKIF